MGDNLAQAAGNKYYPMRELGFDDIGELLQISAANAAKLSRVSAKSGKHPTTGAKEIVWNATFQNTGEAIDLTVYGNMGIGSEILVNDSGTVRIVRKIASSSTPVVGDWYYVNMTVVS